MSQSSAQPGNQAARPKGAWRRQLMVYGTTFRILLSYGAFQLQKRVRGQIWASQALPRLHQRNARRAKNTILQVRGLFIKVGQLVSLMASFLPKDFRGEFEELQDRIPPQPWAGIHRRLEVDWGQAPETLFLEIDTQALAAASLAQVHKGVLKDGRTVAIKVQHENIHRLAKLDLDTVRRIVGIAGFFTGIQGLDGLLEEVTAMIHDELDFRREAAHIQQIREQFQALPRVDAVEVVPQLSTTHVLVTRFVDGVKITDFDAIEAQGIDRPALAERVFDAYCRMILVDGLYHADPHPGNLLVLPDGTVVFLDFGAVGRVSKTMKEGLPQFFEAVLKRDRQEVLRALRRMGFVQRKGGDEVAQGLIDYIYSRFLEDLEFESWSLRDVQFDLGMKAEMFADLRRLDLAVSDLTAAFQIPKEWILLARTHALLFGVCTAVDPDMKTINTLRPFLEELLQNQKSGWLGVARSVVQDFSMAAISLPGDLRRVLQQVERGEGEVEIKGLKESANLFYALGHQFLFTIISLSTGVVAYLAHQRGDTGLANALLWVGGASFFLLCISFWKARKWQRRVRRGTGST